MANWFNLTLDTTAPSNPTIVLENNATYATQQLINATIGIGDGTTTGYQMKIWGDVDTAFNGNIQSAEAGSAWLTYNTTQQLKLSAGDGTKTIYLKIRDDVYNESAIASDMISLDSSLPIVTITGPDVSKISKIAGKNVASFSFTSDTPFIEYKVKVVASSGATQDTGTTIGTAGGSNNMAQTKSDSTTFPQGTAITCSVNGSDLQTASSGDGAKVVKVFVRDQAGNWSV